MSTRIIGAFLLGLLVPIFAGSQQSGSIYQRAGVLSGNRTATVIGNWGVIGQPCNLGPRGAWLYPTNGYIGDMSILVGVELPIKDYNNDGMPDTIHSVITCPVARPTTMTDTDPLTGKYWTFEPVAGFFNPSAASPAISTEPGTWPSSWPDHPEWGSGVWNGLFGPNSFVGAQETFFRMNDRNDERMYRNFGFLPDTADSTVKGQGIQVDVRYLQLNDPLSRDVIFRVFDITNHSKVKYEKVVFGNLNGTYVGITGCDDRPQEYNNDAAVFFSSNDFIMTGNYPENEMKNPLWQGRVGKIGEAFLQSPGDTIASYAYFTPANNLPMGDDERLWKMMMPGSVSHPSSILHDTVVAGGEDGDYMYGSNYFSLDTGETRRIVSVIAYGLSKDDVLQNIFLSDALWHSNFDTTAMRSAVALSNFSSHRTLSGTETIQWTSPAVGGSVDLWFSPDAGRSWKAIGKYIPNTGTLSWNTSLYPDCPFGLLRIFIRDSGGAIYGWAQSPKYFTVNNTAAPAPFVEILNEGLGGDTLTQRFLSLQLLIGDPQAQSLSASLYYKVSPSSDYVLFDAFVAPSDTNPQVRSIGLSLLPNSDEFSLKAIVTNGSAVYGDSTDPFHKLTPRSSVPPSNTEILSGFAEVPVQFHIVDSSKVKPDAYIITFDDTTSWTEKTVTVFNSTAGSYVLRSDPLRPGIESRSFDGLALYANDFLTQMDSVRTHWNRPVSNLDRFAVNALNVQTLQSSYILGYRQPHDYVVAFHDHPVDTSVAVDSLFLASVPIKFEVYDRVVGRRLKVIYAPYGSESDAVFLEDVGGVNRYTWDLYLAFTNQDSMPNEGDTLFIVTKKGLSFYDSLKISGLVLSTGEQHLLPASCWLSQNYPNPFNPATKMSFAISHSSFVTLKVYDVLGREVARLVNEKKPAGEYMVQWNAANLPSGVYFYQLRAGSFVQTKKMLLIR